MKTVFLFLLLMQSLLFASFSGTLIDVNSSLPVKNAIISDATHDVRSDANGSFSINSDETLLHVKAYGYRPYSFHTDTNETTIYLQPIKVKALYLTFWGASNNSKTFRNILELIDQTEANAVVVDVKNEYGSTQFLTGFKQANSYGAHKNRTNRNIQKFIATLKARNIYTIARIVTFKDELQAANNPDYAIKKDDENQTIWRNHDNMAWVDPFDKRSHDYAISIAEEAAKVGYDEINFDYIRFPAKTGLLYSKENTQKNRILAIESFLDEARVRLRKYGVFISVDTYGNICWAKDDNGIGQTVTSLAAHADYLAPMLYPSGFSSGSFYFEHPSEYPYEVVFRSVKTIQDRIPSQRVRPWLQYFRDYTRRKKEYDREEIQAQIKATEDAGTDGWMMWSPSSKYSLKCLGDDTYCF
ncbi:putative glycoside hydrolase [Sulfurimonas paralvinellae]|uniref:GTP-binding protein n=1 Tax=Sulfurimonas paralvinellae TaxID=317658 RepID=A0A7M1BAI0_9BACT|nr:putative glycoside hydrolase [Sulfurimonas paralvinellae]QOP46720.1 GTP-binding protein [Sulfurimonas paralvinellae]